MLSLYDEFAGWGGSSQGAAAVPGVQVAMAVNHVPIAVAVHALNFPDAAHECGDATKLDLTRFPRFDLFWASPSCPPWTDARGVRRDFDRSTQGVLLGADGTLTGQLGPDPDTAKRRALMEEVPRYLRAMAARGRPVLAGVVENVVQVAHWDQLGRWIQEIRTAAPAGYTVRIIALNAMHARPVATRWAPQSRDRFFAAYWLNTLGRSPDWDKWLRPRAWCPLCSEWVYAVQVFKNPRQVMGRYGARTGQYVYRCPRVHGAWRGSRRPGVVEPDVRPALTAIDLSLHPGAKIGERVDAKGRPDPLEPATIARITAGIRRHAVPVPAPVPAVDGGTWRDTATPVTVPTPARTTRERDGLAVPPLLIPVEARAGIDTARPAGDPLRTQTARQETALVVTPFLASLRGGGAKESTRGIDEPLLTFSASGLHHALVQPPAAMVVRHFSSHGDGGEMCTPVDEPLRTLTTKGHQSLVTWGDLLLPYYSNSSARPADQPMGAVTTRDRHALVGAGAAHLTDLADLPVAVQDCTFRMLTPPEIAAGMAFAPDYQVKGTKREQVAGYGNAVCPPAAEVILSALVEAITGEDLPR